MNETKQYKESETRLLGYEIGKPWGNVSIWITDINIANSIKEDWQKEWKETYENTKR